MQSNERPAFFIWNIQFEETLIRKLLFKIFSFNLVFANLLILLCTFTTVMPWKQQRENKSFNKFFSSRVYFTMKANFEICKLSCQYSRQKSVIFQRKLSTLMNLHWQRSFVKPIFLAELWTYGHQIWISDARISFVSQLGLLFGNF